MRRKAWMVGLGSLVAAAVTAAHPGVVHAQGAEGVVLLFDRSDSMGVNADGDCTPPTGIAPTRAWCGFTNLIDRVRAEYNPVPADTFIYFWEFSNPNGGDQVANLDTTGSNTVSIDGIPTQVFPNFPLTSFSNLNATLTTARTNWLNNQQGLGTPLAESFCRAAAFLARGGEVTVADQNRFPRKRIII